MELAAVEGLSKPSWMKMRRRRRRRRRSRREKRMTKRYCHPMMTKYRQHIDAGTDRDPKQERQDEQWQNAERTCWEWRKCPNCSMEDGWPKRLKFKKSCTGSIVYQRA
jgi:hypothetical protein